MQLESTLIYGPVLSRRFGLDLGINLLPLDRKLCCFDCIYCQYGLTPSFYNDRFHFPSASEIVTALQSRLTTLSKNGMHPKHATVAGNGEPTMHPHFVEIAKAIVNWRDRSQPQLKLALLTSGYKCGERKFGQAMQLFDEPVVKFDTAVPHKWLAINRPRVPMSFQEFKKNLALLPGVIFQTMFIRGWNDSAEDVKAWRDAVEKIKPRSIQIYTISRIPALPNLLPVDQDFLQRVASLSSTTGIPIETFY